MHTSVFVFFCGIGFEDVCLSTDNNSICETVQKTGITYPRLDGLRWRLLSSIVRVALGIWSCCNSLLREVVSVKWSIRRCLTSKFRIGAPRLLSTHRVIFSPGIEQEVYRINFFLKLLVSTTHTSTSITRQSAKITSKTWCHRWGSPRWLEWVPKINQRYDNSSNASFWWKT